jgi:hypothetical protein
MALTHWPPTSPDLMPCGFVELIITYLIATSSPKALAKRLAEKGLKLN